MLTSVNYVAVLVAALAAFVIGFLWHGPLFGKQWLAMMNVPQSEVDAAKAKGMGAMLPQMIAAFIQQIVIACAVSHLAMALGIADATQAVALAAFLWFSFIATVMLNTVLWEKRKLNLYFFNVAYHLISMIAVTLIVVLWR